MARIEIPLQEYNTLQSKVEKWEKQHVEDTKNIERLAKANESLKDGIASILGSSWFERIFKWKKIKQIYQS